MTDFVERGERAQEILISGLLEGVGNRAGEFAEFLVDCHGLCVALPLRSLTLRSPVADSIDIIVSLENLLPIPRYPQIGPLAYRSL